MKRLAVTVFAAACALTALQAQNRSFAIFVDNESYAKCGREIEAYRQAVCDDGLDAYVLAADWANPEQVRDSIRFYYENKALDGTVFIGDIPIPMVRGAQHMTSAFKMDENGRYGIRETSVPCDRFYDDFDLKFDFIKRDSTETLFFYYRLAADSAQEIKSDIYSARMKPSSDWGDKYEELAAYLEKVVRIKKENNEADRIVSYTGAGSYSNSLVAWKDETEVVAEQFPKTKLSEDGSAKFYVFAMHDYPKDYMIPEIQKDENDLVFFHEHGMPERQYLSDSPAAGDLDEYYETALQRLRGRIERTLRYKGSTEKVKEELAGLGLDSTWYNKAIAPSKEDILKDSLDDVHSGITLKDVQEAKPNARVVLFDACYNGDFRESDCIASRYIFAGGNTVVGLGNSVNVLQDKSSVDLMGMLSCGYRVGEWMRECNILESHIHGDPTFRFASSWNGQKPDPNNTSCEYWKGFLSEEYPCDIQSLALTKLFDLKCEGLSKIILNTYKASPYFMLRLQCLHLGAHFCDGSYTELLKLGADDPYEFIRRQSAYYMGKIGSPELAEKLAQMYLNDYNALRVCFNISMAMAYFDRQVMADAIQKVLGGADWLYDKEGFLKEAMRRADYAANQFENMRDLVLNTENASAKKRIAHTKNLRNNPYPLLANDIIKVVKDNSEDLNLRINFAEYLGWYVRAWNKVDIVNQLKAYTQGTEEIPAELKNEIIKSINRLSEYTRI